MFQDLLAKLYALEFYYKTGHWQARNDTFYGDHLLFDRLSEDASKYIDKTAEKAIGITNDPSIVDLPAILQKTFELIKNCPYNSPENHKIFEYALILEHDLISFCEMHDVVPGVPIGVKALLEEIADDSEGRVYLLRQRTSKGGAVPPMIQS